MQYLSVLLLAILASPVFAQIEPAPKQPIVKDVTFKTIAPATVKAGDHILIDASSAKGDVFFFYDEVAFPKTRATHVGKLLILSTGVNGKYTINVASLDDKAKEKIVVTVTDGADPGPMPSDPPVIDPPTTLEKKVDAILKDMAALTARVTALEGAKPPPVSAVAKHVTFVGAEVNAGALATNNDASLRTTLKSAGLQVHVLKKDDPMIIAKGLAAAVAKAGGVPVVIVQDELGNVIDQGPMTSVSQVTEFVTKYIRR